METPISVILHSGCEDQLEASLAAAKSGDSRGFEAILDRFQGQVFNLACWVLGDPGEAEDVCQEVFLKFLKHMRGLSVQKNLQGWFSKVTLNLARNRLRSRRRRTALDDHHADGLTITQNTHFEAENWLNTYLPTLTFKERAALVLVHIFGFSTKEASVSLGCRQGTVKALCHRARTKLIQHSRKGDHR